MYFKEVRPAGWVFFDFAESGTQKGVGSRNGILISNRRPDTSSAPCRGMSKGYTLVRPTVTQKNEPIVAIARFDAGFPDFALQPGSRGAYSSARRAESPAR